MTDRIPNPEPRIPSALQTAANGLISVLLAPACAACSEILDSPLNGCVCRNCWAGILPITPPICDCCGDPLSRLIESRIPNPESRQHCRRCSESERSIRRARTVGEYEGALRQIIHAFKYDRRRSLAAGLAQLMRARGCDVLRHADYVVPVPLHRRRERSRGFNQARELACHLGPPVLDILVRRRYTRPQIELAADRRQANVRGAFALRPRWFGRMAGLGGLTVVLVDDVSTTGATLEACAVVLKESGARDVYALTAARVVTRAP